MSSSDDRGQNPNAPDPDAGTTERRTEPRRHTDAVAVIKFLDPLQASVRVPGTVIDISRSGLRLRVGTQIMPGTLVQVRFEDKVLMGDVRFCNPSGEEFEAGVRLQDVFDTGAGSKPATP